MLSPGIFDVSASTPSSGLLIRNSSKSITQNPHVAVSSRELEAGMNQKIEDIAVRLQLTLDHEYYDPFEAALMFTIEFEETLFPSIIGRGLKKKRDEVTSLTHSDASCQASLHGWCCPGHCEYRCTD